MSSATRNNILWSAVVRNCFPKQQNTDRCILEGCGDRAYKCPSEEKNPFPGRCLKHWQNISARTALIGPWECWVCGNNRKRTFRIDAYRQCKYCCSFGVPGHHPQCRQSQAFIWRGEDAYRTEEQGYCDSPWETRNCDCTNWMGWVAGEFRPQGFDEPDISL